MIEASAPKLPESPTPEQLDAWIELAELVSDASFVQSLRNDAKEMWGKFDMAAMRRAGDAVAAAAKDALARSIAPDSFEARAIVEKYGAALAAAKGVTFGDETRRRLRERFEKHDARAARYWELIAVMKGSPSVASTVAEWKWIRAAVLHHF
jgi:hypothetical protein